MLLTAHVLLYLFLRSRKKLCRDGDVLAFSKIAQRAADILLAGSALISNGRIVKVDAKLQTPLDNFSGIFFADGPAVPTASGIPEPHTAHADTGYVQIGKAKFYVFHAFT